jgi:hypothetical protein
MAIKTVGRLKLAPILFFSMSVKFLNASFNLTLKSTRQKVSFEMINLKKGEKLENSRKFTNERHTRE